MFVEGMTIPKALAHRVAVSVSVCAQGPGPQGGCVGECVSVFVEGMAIPKALAHRVAVSVSVCVCA